MELTWINKLRIAAVASLGILVFGIVLWPLAAPEDPLMPVRAWTIGSSRTMVLLITAFAVGFAGYFVAWPHGREIGILAVPFGLAIWAGRSGPMRALNQIYTDTYERQALLRSLRFEPAYWLVLVAAGFAGVLAARHLRPVPDKPISTDAHKGYLNTNTYVNGVIAIVVSLVTAQFFIRVFAQNLGAPGVATQPAVGQILFGVTAAFAVAAFVVKKFLNLSYIWPAVASIFVTAFAEIVYCRGETVQRFAETQPATFFPHSVLAILPVQLVALGALGSIIGYWLAVKYDYWRKHEGTE
jgi:hypothetical protein